MRSDNGGLNVAFKGDPGALMRLAMLHLANAIAKEGVASNLHQVRRRAHQLERNDELLKTIEFCREAMAVTAKRSYRRRMKPVRRDVRKPPPQKQPERRPAS